MRTNKARAGRIRTTFPAQIHPDGGPTVSGYILNISKFGFRLRLAALAIGDRVSVDCEGLSSKGQIVWAHGTEAGGRFLESLRMEPSIGRL
ncbi:PilZ domain-containing protein [Sphingomonas rhizophila]|uniref:PilZ domain-containing protein n=2 Tax=Sphingomonas rhizophila TaxID=2071607 RepID=A0A7G9SBP4_9SPHN|nr:PilZ domain-containing protein [Sphingomonas rhizophila]